MRRQTSKALTLILALLAASSCSTPSRPKIVSVPPPLAVTPTVSLEKGITALLVKEEEAKRWPHLKRHIGQLILANGDTQVVLPAAPPLSTGQDYFALTSKVYRRSGKNWFAIPWLPSLEIRMNGKTGEALQLVGQDIVSEGGITSIHAFFRQNNSGSADARLVITLQADQARLDIKVLGTAGKIPWSLRLGRGIGEDFTIPIEDSRVAGVTSSLLPDAVSVIGESLFAIKQDDAFNQLNAGENASGFKILLARDALLKQADLIQSLMPCYLPSEPNTPCKPSKLSPKTWKIAAPPPKTGDSRLWQSALLYTKQGTFRSLIPIREGETLDLPLSAKKMDLLVSDGEGVLQKVKGSGKTETMLSLPQLKKGQLVVNFNPPVPQYVELKNAVQNKGKSLEAWSTSTNKILLNPNTLLQSTWPLDIALPAGDYQLRVYDGYQIACDQRLTLLTDRKTAIDCAPKKDIPKFSVRASISVDRAAIPDALIAASGIRIITSSENSKASNLLEIPVLAAYDSELGLSMRAFPSSEALEKSWNLTIKVKPDRSTLTHFAEFVRSHDAEASLVLDCPPAGFQIAEYKWIVQNIRPDVLEVFGCGQPESSNELLSVAGSLQAKQNKAVRLAAASFSGSMFGSRVPAIYLPRFVREAKLDAKLAADDLKMGHYTLGFRTELIVPSVKSTDDKITLGIRTADTQKRDIVIRVYDQDERLSEEAFQLGGSYESSVTASLRLKPSSRWIRIELLAREKAASGDGPLFTLATSNFFGLDGVL